jgi:microcystin-dependent protein
MISGGNQGDRVGSVQEYATARPVKPIVVTAVLCQTNIALQGGDEPTSYYNFEAVLLDIFTSGGDKESRPKNVNVAYWTLYRQGFPPGSLADKFPIGGVIAFPSNVPPDPSMWLLCDGRLLSATDLKYSDLYAQIVTCNGGVPGKTFNLPNYQGYFMRGANNYHGFDPDWQTRTAAAPGGQTQGDPGSLQDWATGKPTSINPVTLRPNYMAISFTHLPVTPGNSNAQPTSPKDNAARWTESASPAGVYDGDNETRPINVGVDFYIKYKLAVPPT